MYEIPQGADVICHLLRKRERFAYQPATALAQGMFEPVNVTGLAAIFPTPAMACRWQVGRICLPKIGVTDSTLAIDRCKTGPQPACGRFCPRSGCYADNFACIAVNRQ